MKLAVCKCRSFVRYDEHMLKIEFSGKEFYLQKVFISYVTPHG